MYEFYRNYLSVNLKDYENLGIDLEISKVLLGLLIGVIIASIFVSLQNTAMITLIKKLNRQSCIDEKSAKTLDELGINSFSVRMLIKTSSRVGRLISYVGAKEYTYEEYSALMKKKRKKNKNAGDNSESTPTESLEEKPDLKTRKFYLKDVKSTDTKNILDKKKDSLLNTILMCVLFIAIYIIILFLMPDILSLINSILS